MLLIISSLPCPTNITHAWNYRLCRDLMMVRMELGVPSTTTSLKLRYIGEEIMELDDNSSLLKAKGDKKNSSSSSTSSDEKADSMIPSSQPLPRVRQLVQIWQGQYIVHITNGDLIVSIFIRSFVHSFDLDAILFVDSILFDFPKIRIVLSVKMIISKRPTCSLVPTTHDTCNIPQLSTIVAMVMSASMMDNRLISQVTKLFLVISPLFRYYRCTFIHSFTCYRLNCCTKHTN
jgi:hypothetical protein